MAIHSISDNGDMHWKCAGRQGKCQKDNYAHVTHDAVMWVDDLHVRLPACTACGAVCTLRVAFTDEEMVAPNKWEMGMIPTEIMLPHAITGEMMPVMIPALKPVGVNLSFERHKYVATKLREHGKHPPLKANIGSKQEIEHEERD